MKTKNVSEIIVTKNTDGSRSFHVGKTDVRISGSRVEFTGIGPKGETYSAIMNRIGGLAVAKRIAPLFDSSVTRTGNLGAQRGNINRLIETHRMDVNPPEVFNAQGYIQREARA